jgi:hypothetical protein
VISKAQELDSVLVSLDGDFADIVAYPPATYNGIIALKVGNHPEVIPRLVVALQDYLSAHPDMNHYEDKGKLLLVQGRRIRVRE